MAISPKFQRYLATKNSHWRREVEGHEVTCPWHGARFDIRTGQVLCAPAYGDVTRYNVRVSGADIEVEV